MKSEHPLILHYKKILKCVKYINVRKDTIKLLEGNMG